MNFSCISCGEPFGSNADVDEHVVSKCLNRVTMTRGDNNQGTLITLEDGGTFVHLVVGDNVFIKYKLGRIIFNSDDVYFEDKRTGR